MTKRDRFELVGNTIASTFRVDEVVAEGGFGVVYRAFHLHFRAPVALKCLKIPSDLSDEERTTFLEQFRSEAEIMFRLSTSLPNIVRPLHVDAVQSASGEFVPLMALEWLEGQSFEKIIEERALIGVPPLSLDEVVQLIEPAAYALDEAHDFQGHGERLSVIHRDVKPDNLFLCTSGPAPLVKILDFGISKVKVKRNTTDAKGRASQTDALAPFSPAYGAPEQWLPKRYGPTGPWTDVWGLALTLVEIVKGDAVIVGDHQAMMGTALDAKVRPTPRNEGVDVSDAVEAVFQKALAIDPRFRYQTVRSFWEDLVRARALGASEKPAQKRAQSDQPSSDSQRRIRVESKAGLPPMSAPTPWTPPVVAVEGRDTGGVRATSLTGLPPMLAPAPMQPSRKDELDAVAFYPNDPTSGLAPVPPAPGSYEPDEILIPPLDDEAGSRAPLPRTHTGSRRTASGRNPPIPREEPPSPRAPDFKIELEATSMFPREGSRPAEPPHASLASPRAPNVDASPSIPDLGPPLPLIPARHRKRRETG